MRGPFSSLAASCPTQMVAATHGGLCTYRVKREHARHLVPLGLLVWQPSEPLAHGPGQGLAPLVPLGVGVGLACQSTGEGVPALGDRVASMLRSGHEFSYGDIVGRIWKCVSLRSQMSPAGLMSSHTKGQFWYPAWRIEDHFCVLLFGNTMRI